MADRGHGCRLDRQRPRTVRMPLLESSMSQSSNLSSMGGRVRTRRDDAALMSEPFQIVGDKTFAGRVMRGRDIDASRRRRFVE